MKKSISLFELISPKEKKLIHKTAMPDFLQPMLAMLIDTPFSGKDWLFERKLDGERCLIFKNGKRVFIKSRNNNVLNQSYPEIVAIVEKMPVSSCVIDGEVVAFENKITKFSLLQARFGITKQQ